MTCIAPGCPLPVIARDRCRPHYRRWHRGSDDLSPVRSRSAAARLWRRIAWTPTCWTWTGSVLPSGYGKISTGPLAAQSGTTAHRAVYEAFVGPIPEGLHLDHLCRNRLCVRPDHLEPVTQAENNRRARAATQEAAA